MTITVEDVDSTVQKLARSRSDIWTASACGVTRADRRIVALIDRDAYVPDTDRVRVLLVGGLSGRPGGAAMALYALRLFADAGHRLSSKIALSAVPCGNPGGLTLRSGPSNGAGGFANAGYPPMDGFYNHQFSPEPRYIWRWICYQAPDLVLELQSGQETRWGSNAAAGPLSQALEAVDAGPADSLIAALGRGAADSPGTIPGLRLNTPPASFSEEIERLWELLITALPGPSEARATLNTRRSRSHVEVGRDLGKTNGRTLSPLIYTQGVAISGRLRLSSLDPATMGNLDDVAALVDPVVADPAKAFGTAPQAPNLAAIVWAEELGSSTADPRYNDASVVAASYFAPRDEGEAPLPLNTNFIVEDFFFASAVLGRAYRATNDLSYINLLTEFLLGAGTQEDSGLFPHSRRGPFHWGRGNGFAALGLAEALTYMPANYPSRNSVLGMCQKQMEALKHLQEPSGTYLQLIDFPGSYQELTATCMIGYSMARGIRLGWLDGSYRSVVDLAWQGVSERVDPEGNIVDGCTGTGVLDNLRSYLDRPANSGYDDRSGSMALWFAAEMERLARCG